MAEFTKKFKHHFRDQDYFKRRDYSQEFEYKRKDEKDEAVEYVQKQSQPIEPTVVEPAMKEAEPESKHENSKKKRGSGFGFNSSFAQRSGKLGGQDRWANDKKGHQEDEPLEEAPKEAQQNEYNTRPKYGQFKSGYRKENLTYYERKHPSENKVEPDYYKSTTFDLSDKVSQTTGSSSAINWNTQNKRRQETESDEYEDQANYAQNEGYYSKPAYKRGYKHDDDRKYYGYSKNYKNQKHQDYDNQEADYEENAYQADDYYAHKRGYRADRGYTDRSDKAGYNHKHGENRYNNYEKEDNSEKDTHQQEPRNEKTNPDVPARQMGGRAFKLPTTEDPKKQDSRDPKKKELVEKPQTQSRHHAPAEEVSKNPKTEVSERNEVI